jgi:hypothetical protein
VFDLPGGTGTTSSLPSTSAERIVELTWTPDGSRLVVITRQAGPPLRARIFLVNAANDHGTDTQSQPDALVLLPAEVLPNSVAVDPSGRWLALVSHASVAPGGSDVLNACLLELAAGGGFHDVADLGTLDRAPSTAPFAWAPSSSGHQPRLVFVSPVPSSSSGSSGPFGFFGALRPAPPALGLFVVDVEASGLGGMQPRRLGSITGVVGPVWRSDGNLSGFVRQDDGTLALRSIDPDSGTLHDAGVRLPAGAGQGTGLAARWDGGHGYALLLSRPNTLSVGSSANSAIASLQAWLVSFVDSRNG